MSEETIDKILYLINKKKMPLSIIVRELNLNEHDKVFVIEALENKGLSLRNDGDSFVKTNRPKGKLHYIKSTKRALKIGAYSDTHLANIYDRINAIQYIYEQGEKRSVDFFVHAGDFFEGILSFVKNHNLLLKELTPAGQLDYACEYFPVSSIPTFVIGGNHDIAVTKEFGIDLLDEFSKQRDSIIYLGPDIANIQYGSLRILLEHGRIHKVERKISFIKNDLIKYEEKTAPHLYITGHIHQPLYTKYNYTHVFQCSSLLSQTDQKTSRGVVFPNSIWWINLEMDDQGKIQHIEVQPEEIEPTLKKNLY